MRSATTYTDLCQLYILMHRHEIFCFGHHHGAMNAFTEVQRSFSVSQVSACACRCAIDQQPRSLSSQQLGVLAHLAEMVVRRVERDKQIMLQQHSKTALLRSLRTQQEAVLLCDTAMTSWPVLFTNKSCHDMLGWDEGTLGGRGVWDIFKMDAGAKVCHLSISFAQASAWHGGL